MKLKRFFFLLILSAAIFFALFRVKLPYLLILPGEAKNVLPLIEFPHRPMNPSGKLYLTTVYVIHTTPAFYLFGILDPHAELLHDRISSALNNKIETEQMSESQLMAEVVAFKAADSPVQLEGTGVKILKILKISPNKKILKKGDIIIKINHHPSPFISPILSYLTHVKPGKTVRLTILRKGGKIRVHANTMKNPSGKGSRLGIWVVNSGIKLKSQIPVHIQLRHIEGSSAGLILSLGIYDLLKGGNLLKGQIVAGTGTIDPEGNVGPIEGIAQKIRTAAAVQARYFFCPVQNYAKALKNADGLKIIPVKNFNQALKFLKNKQT